MPLNRLAIQTRAYSEGEHRSRGNVGEQEGFIVASEGDDVRDYTEDRIIIHKKGVGFPVTW